MTYLDKAMFGDLNCHAFGLTNGQQKNQAVLHNAGWFNQDGEKLGYGDVTLTDIRNIHFGLASDNECFAILSEKATGWNLPTQLNSAEPGPDYIKANALWFVTTSGMYHFDACASGLSEVFHNNKFAYYEGNRADILAKIGSIFDAPVAKTAAPVVSQEKYYGLPVVAITEPNGVVRKWAYGNRGDIFAAAKQYCLEFIWLEPMTDMSKYLSISKEEIDLLAFLADQKDAAIMPLLRRIMGPNQVDSWATDVVHARGVSVVSCYDGQMDDSDNITGLPPGFRAFRVY